MKVLVTGSSGFIGTNLSLELQRQGHEILGIDIRPQRPVSHAPFSLCDILDGKELKKIICQFAPEFMVHLAARTDLDEKHEINGYAVNIQGVENLIDAIKSCKSLKRCIFTSSQLVCKIGHVPSSFDEYCPNTLYGQSKVIAEKIVKRNDGGGAEWCLVRPTTIWGPHETHYLKFFHLVKSGRYFHIGKKPLKKSYGFVGNAVHQYIKLLASPATRMNKRTFYIADYQPISLQDWADEFQRRMNAPKIRIMPVPVAKVLARIGDLLIRAGIASFPLTSFRLGNIMTEYVFDMSATENLCGPVPFTMPDGVKLTVDWFREGTVRTP
jgi:GlcNAc-P-P-Und epimerase